MSTPRQGLGDSHNFGRRVEVRGGRVHKPRTVFWEWLLLAGASPLRRLLDELAGADGLGRGAFGFLPDLAFESPRARTGSEVTHVDLAPLPDLSPGERRELARITGRFVALAAWLGISDLHWENLVLGASADGRIVLAPLDVEIVLDDMALPTATKLLPDADPEYAAISRHAAGVRRVLPYLGKPVEPADLLAMAGAYHATLALLDRRARAIADTLAAVPGFREAPIRVLLRGTGEYVHAETSPPWPPLLDAEREQMARGDVPYFFRLYGEKGIHYFAEPSLETTKTLPRTGDVPRLEPLLSIGRGLRAPSRASLREQGLFTLLAAFDDRSYRGTHEGDGLTVRFGARTLVITLPDGTELEAPRDLRRVVGSVYLPCTCGEARSVFVPPVTVCDAPRGRAPAPRAW